MGSAITLAGEDLIAQKTVTNEALDVVRFLFALVPGLDPAVAVDRAAPKPPAEQIVHSALIPAEGKRRINDAQLVYSVRLGSDIGDWDFNWLGLETAEGVLLAVSYVPTQQKRRNVLPLQMGNNLTRNFLLRFDGAQALTGLTIDASTWQHDFTVRLGSIDERERLSNRDIYGRSAFFGDALRLALTGGATYELSPGIAYAEGIRIALEAPAVLDVPAIPTTAWIDAALERDGSDVLATWGIVWGDALQDYTDTNGVRHYCIPIAHLPDAATVINLRSELLDDGALAAQAGNSSGLQGRLYFFGQL